MSVHVRLLPVVAAVCFGALALKAVGVVEMTAFAESEAAADAAAEAPAPLPSPTGAESGEFVPAGEIAEEPESELTAACPADAMYASEAGLSQYEIQVLRTLADRRETLEARERDLDTRSQLVLASEARLDEKIAQIETLKGAVEGLLGQLDDAQAQRLADLVRVYESMKAKDAAAIFEALDDKVLLDVATRMKPANLAAVMGAMTPQRAREVTRMLAARAEIPETAEDLLSEAGRPPAAPRGG